MDYMSEINKLMAEFCENVPARGTEPEYLEVAAELEKLHTETAVITNSNLSEKEIEERLEQIYQKMVKAVSD